MELDMDFAAIKLMEVLYEKGLINKETLQAAQDRWKEKPHNSQIA